MRLFREQIAQRAGAILDLDASHLADAISDPPSQELGDLSLPCFQLAGPLKKAPAAIATQLAAAQWDFPWIEGVDTAGPYLNFKLRRDHFARLALERVEQGGEQWGAGQSGAGKRVLVEYSSPNIAKHLAVHHLRSTMLGQAMANLLRCAGHEVISWNHLGDWGTGFGKLLACWDQFRDTDNLDDPPLESREDPVSDLNALYVQFNQASESDPQLDSLARDWFRKLESGDPHAVERWQRIRSVSLDKFDTIYQRLGVHFDETVGESHYQDAMLEMVDQLKGAGILEQSDGADVVRLSEEIPPMLIRKQDGATLYGTRDLASAVLRHQMFPFDRCLYVVDAGQGLHFRQVFGVLKLLGYSWADQLEHAEFGVMRLQVDGAWKKGKTRGGQVVLLEDVLEQSVQLASDKVRAKNPDLDDDQVAQISEAVGVGAVIFSDMKSARRKDVNFDLDKILSFDGETGPYLQYTHVRFCSILRKASPLKLVSGGGERLVEAEELVLLKRILRFPEVIARAARDAEPSHLSQYLLELAGEFNTYYAQHRVISDDAQLSGDRLALVEALRRTLGRGLKLLCVEPLERM
ncbi:MAG: arginine--tRNA ligase [Planctomycetes bacterium]|nr:arginine--tRNA ligase [Planctomycetota bacterium]